MARLLERYQSEVLPQLKKDFSLDNPMELPHITKVTCNIGIGEASRNAKLIDMASEQLASGEAGPQVHRGFQAPPGSAGGREGDDQAGSDVRVPRPSDQHRPPPRA